MLKALQRLESELLVEQIPRRGMYVKKVEIKEIRDIFQCRAVIEGLSAKLAAENMTPQQVQILRACFEPFLHQKDIDVAEYAKADRLFHHQIMKWSENAVILRLEILNNIHLRAYQAGLLRPPSETMPEHFAIVEALSQKNGNQAETLMRQHIERSLAAIEFDIKQQQM